MKKIIFLIYFLGQFPNLTFSQNTNLEKYWIYRERAKNFIAPGLENGMGIPANARKRIWKVDNTGYKQSIIYDDAPWNLGYWIGNLAMEYHLLSIDNGDLTETKRDLFFALNAINRLDIELETVFGCNPSLNGSTLRDDVPGNFPGLTFEGKSVNENLNSSWVPPLDHFRLKIIDSALECYIPGAEMSQDHWIGLFIGFALVKKFVPLSACYIPEGQAIPLYFEDSEFRFLKEAQNIAERFMNWVSIHDWWYENTCTNNCVRGVCNTLNPLFYTFSPDSSILIQNSQGCGLPLGIGLCNAGGADLNFFAWGFAKANEYIQGPGYINTYALNPLLVDLWNLMSFSNVFKIQKMALTLAALGDISQSSSFFSTDIGLATVLKEKGEEYHWEHLILLNRVLHGGTFLPGGDLITIDNSHFECLLNTAPCFGPGGTETRPFNFEWNYNDRLGGNRGGGNVVNTMQSGISFMFYFNLYNIINPNYLNYSKFEISSLAPFEVHKWNYNEYDTRNFMASNLITATEYTIKADPVEGYGHNQFVSGNKIEFHPGFRVEQGGKLNAYITPIYAMTCEDMNPAFTNCDVFFLPRYGYSNNSEEEQKSLDENWKEKSFDNKFEVLVSPNPSNTYTKILGNFKESGLFSMVVFDNLGKEILRKSEEEIPQKGDIELIIKTDQWASGMYFCKFSFIPQKSKEKETIFKKIIVIK